MDQPLLYSFNNYKAACLGRMAAAERLSVTETPFDASDPRYSIWLRTWWDETLKRRKNLPIPMDEFRKMRRSDGVLNFTSPVRIIVDASTDGHRSAYAALVRVPGDKPRLIYKTHLETSFSTVEQWARNDVLRRVERRFQGQKPILLFTDDLFFVQTHGCVHIQYRWVPRTNILLKHMHQIANSLRKSLPAPTMRVKRVSKNVCKL